MHATKSPGLWRAIILLAAVAALTLAWPRLELAERATQLEQWIEPLGLAGPAAYSVIFAVAVVLVFPASALAVGAGGLFGPWVGTAAAFIGANLGSMLAFVVARRFARESVGEWLSRKHMAQQVDDLVTEHGSMAVALTRLLPVFPFGMTSYAFGLSGVPFRTYVYWTALGSLPGTVVYVFGSAGAVDTLMGGRVRPGVVVVFLIALVTVVAGGTLTARKIKRDRRG